MKTQSAALSLAASNEQPMASSQTSLDTLIAATSQIVSAYIVNRPAEQVNITALTADVFATLRSLAQNETAATQAGPRSMQRPVVSVEDSIKADYLICLEDGKRVKMLKRYLKTAYNLSPEEYRARWSLPATYPMVAPNYAKVRSKLAKEIGLGHRGKPDSAMKRMKSASIVATSR